MQSASAAANHLLAPPTSPSSLSRISLANESQGFEEEGGAVVSSPSLPEHAPNGAPPLAPPLPPPLPIGNPAERKRRVRSFYWKPIPEDRVKHQDGPNLWSFDRSSRDPLHIDIRAIEELFGHEDTSSASTTSTTIGRRRDSVKDLRPKITILGSKRSLNISIFLKHFKKSTESLLDDILLGNTGVFSVESLRELLKLLPEEDEVKNLQMFSGNPKDLAPPDAFIHQLIRLPRYEVRLEALLLKEEFFPSYTVMKQDMTVILSAIKELLSCEELHNVFHLVLQAGNIMNAGGSAGNAVGFKLSSLPLLADTKANKPGINLLHFVALEAQKKDLLMFPEKLQHVQQAARVCVDSIHDEFDALTRRVHQLQQNIHTDDELLLQLQSFLQSAAGALEDLRISIDEVQRQGDALIDFLCEDRDVFKLDECLRIFQNFCSKFKKAVQENMERGMWEESRRKRLKESEDKRHLWAGHEGVGGVSSLQSNSKVDVAVALKREGLMELLETSPESLHCSPQQNNLTLDPCGTDTLVLPPIHSLSITNVTEETEIKTLSIQESQNNDLQTQSQETLGNKELTPNMTFDPSQISLVVEPELINDKSEGKTKDNVWPTTESLKTSAGAKQIISKRTFGPKNRASLSVKSPSSSTKATSSSSSPKCVSSSETASVRKLVPLHQPSSSVRIQERPSGSILNVVKKTPAVRPEEKMCRATLRALDRPSPETSVRNSMLKPPSFARNTVASTTRHTTAHGNQSKAPPLTHAASLRLSQVVKPQQTPAESVRPSPPAGRLRKSSTAASQSSVFTRGSRDKDVKPTWR
ncbi:FH2 domain-containing protein 1 [Carassius carassius]|uniref:FH2 domain-containing protein 1 n=1 Tax=Carassius carassius TaxID=217509 RepID=UPI002869749E|nr:FH2 domain-containing protein 1 [Carassius carassius]XP_059384502.1 FH2 domain-containing protein 1 [Carassius carassius]